MKTGNILVVCGVGASLGLGTFAATYALKNTPKEEHKTKFTELSESINDLQNLYDDHSDLHDSAIRSVNINAQDIKKVPNLLAERVAHIEKLISDSDLELYNAIKKDMTPELQGIQQEFKNSQGISKELIDSTMTKVASLNEKYLSLETWKKILDKEIKEVISEFTSSKSELWDAVAILKNKAAEIQSNADVNKENVLALQQKIALVNDKLLQIKLVSDEIKIVEEEVSNLSEELKLVSTEQQSNSQEITEIKSVVEAMQESIKKIDQNFSQFQVEISGIEDEITNIDSNIKSFQMSIDLYGKVMQNTQSNIAQIKGDMTNLKNSITELEKHKDKSKNQMEEIKTELNNINTKVTDLEKNIPDLFKQMQDLEKNNQSFAKDLLNISRLVESIQNEVKNINSSKTNVNYTFNRELVTTTPGTKKPTVKTNFKPIFIPNIEKAVRLNMDVQICWGGTNKLNQIVNIVDTYPKKGFDLVSSAITTDNRTYLMNINVVNSTININGILYRFKGQSFKNITKLRKNGTLTITLKNVSVLYEN